MWNDDGKRWIIIVTKDGKENPSSAHFVSEYLYQNVYLTVNDWSICEIIITQKF